MSIELVRVDDRLVHGQVLVAWGRAVRATHIVVVDDEVAADPWERELLRGLAGEVTIDVVPIAEAAAQLTHDGGRGSATIVLFRSPAAALRAVEAGASMRHLNVGGMHYAPGKTRLLDYVYVDDADRDALRALSARGVRLSAQDVPATRPVDLEPLLDGGLDGPGG